MIKGADTSGRVSSGLFDLDHFSAEVAEKLSADQAPFIGQIQDTIGVEKTRVRHFINTYSKPFQRDGCMKIMQLGELKRAL
jgi:hypothetical protein